MATTTPMKECSAPLAADCIWSTEKSGKSWARMMTGAESGYFADIICSAFSLERLD